ncbi:MAG TPA: SpoIIE family protein phosphatase [Longimicrobiaceae bacterium]|nr:SpoIIE family protein phosphatase [Longimicrobiaceae bacterium]
MPSPPPHPTAPPALDEILAGFRRAHRREAFVWFRDGSSWTLAAGTTLPPGRGPGPDAVPLPGGAWSVEVTGGEREAARFLASVLHVLLQNDAEVRFFSRELAERYEEITLLYSISEILGSVISLEEAASTILSEVAGTLSVRRVALWLYDPGTERLDPIATVGEGAPPKPVRVDDGDSVTAAVFRERRPVILEAGDEYPRADDLAEVPHRGAFLSVPVSYTPPDGETRTIGVINLVGRGEGQGFSAGDQKLITAIASQIGAAVENSRLVEASLRQERLVREMELAHDLQMKLLPPLDQFSGYADVAARCAPADSVGGDFYHLFRLPGGRLGVMIGDVSSHGFGAALIMALTMSAVAIHASEGDSPGEVLRRAHETLIDELETTEMYLTLFYGVIDPGSRRLTYANAGHQHAFRVGSSGDVERLAATDPPFGIVDLGTYGEESIAWTPGEDLLFLFTDGLADALAAGEAAGETLLVDLVARDPCARTGTLLERVFDLTSRPTEIPPDDRTAVLVRI